MADETIGTYYFQLAPSTEGIGSKINEAMGDAGTSGSKSFGTSFKKGAGIVGKVVAEAVGAVATGISTITTLAVKNYGEYEQLTGGVDKLFGTGSMGLEEYAASVGKSVSEAAAEFTTLQEASASVMANAQNAFSTAGLSANEYMETVTGFSAALISSLEGDTTEAASIADMAIRDMADNANVFGTDMESIQNAYQGFAKQNYTMLDNLKLGYGGTEKEMERLLADATTLANLDEPLSIDNYNDVIEAIHIMQESMSITGTTAKEASGTIEGSLNSLKSAWQNTLTAVAADDDTFESSLDGLVSTATSFAENIAPRIATAVGGIGK